MDSAFSSDQEVELSPEKLAEKAKKW